MPRVCTCQRLRNLSRLCRRCCRSSATTSPRATRAPGPRPANTWRDAPRANAPARAGKASAAACPAPASAASAQTRARGTPPNAMNSCPRGTAPARSRAAARRPPHAGTSMRAGRLAHSGRTALGSDGTDAHREEVGLGLRIWCGARLVMLGDDVLGGAQQALGEAQGALGVDAVERGREVGRHNVEARRGPAAGGGVPAACRPRGEREAGRGGGRRAWPGGAGRCSGRARATQAGCGAQRRQPWTMYSVSVHGQP